MPVSTEDFRRFALALPGALESAHMHHPDFRVCGKIFATLSYPDKRWGMVKLPPEEQDNFMRAEPAAFIPAKGAWGRKGSTCVLLNVVTKAALRAALFAAWKARAPKTAVRPEKPAR